MAKTPKNWRLLPERTRELIKQGKSDTELALALDISIREARLLRRINRPSRPYSRKVQDLSS